MLLYGFILPAVYKDGIKEGVATHGAGNLSSVLEIEHTIIKTELQKIPKHNGASSTWIGSRYSMLGTRCLVFIYN